MNRFIPLAAVVLAVLLVGGAHAQDKLRIGVITFLSGPVAGPFGVPARNASDLIADAMNKGGIVPGHATRGFGGRVTLANIKFYEPGSISPADGMKSID